MTVGFRSWRYEGKAQSPGLAWQNRRGKGRCLRCTRQSAIASRSEAMRRSCSFFSEGWRRKQGTETGHLTYLENAGQFATQSAVLPNGGRRHVRTGDNFIAMPEISPQRTRVLPGPDASQRVGDRYYVPRNLTILADLKARRGRLCRSKGSLRSSRRRD